MDTAAGGDDSDVINSQTISIMYQKNISLSEGSISQLFSELSEEVREDLFNYLDRLGLVIASGMLVIPSTRHFFYDADDLKGVKTIENPLSHEHG